MKIFPVYYFPPVSWFSAALACGEVTLEQFEHYKKQHYFNRMEIKTPDKILKLSVPVRKAPERLPLRLREIANDSDWQRNHWMSLISAYRSSPWFEFYEDHFEAHFQENHTNLLEHNMASIQLIIDLLKLDIKIELTGSWKEPGSYEVDFRTDFDPREGHNPGWFNPVPYQQVFGEDFAADLSVFDLICNKGPESVTVLREGFKG